MSRGAKGRDRYKRGRIERRDARARVAVVVEGKNTEPQYLNGLAKSLEINLAQFKVIITKHSDTLSLVRDAIDQKRGMGRNAGSDQDIAYEDLCLDWIRGKCK